MWGVSCGGESFLNTLYERGKSSREKATVAWESIIDGEERDAPRDIAIYFFMIWTSNLITEWSKLTDAILDMYTLEWVYKFINDKK